VKKGKNEVGEKSYCKEDHESGGVARRRGKRHTIQNEVLGEGEGMGSKGTEKYGIADTWSRSIRGLAGKLSEKERGKGRAALTACGGSPRAFWWTGGPCSGARCIDDGSKNSKGSAVLNFSKGFPQGEGGE